MGDRTTSRPETTWGAIRTVIQAGTGVAFWLEDLRSIALFLFAVAVVSGTSETVAWWRARNPRAVAPAATRRHPRPHARPRAGARSGHRA